MQIADYPSFLNIGTDMSLTALVSTVFSFLLIIAGLAAFIMVVWGGVKYLTSSGNASITRDAKKQIFAALLGLIILFSAWMILSLINPELVNIKEPGSIPQPEAKQPEVPATPAPETPAAFYYIPLGKVIDNVISQERETLPKMREFANLAARCGRDLCEGGECEYWVPEACPEEPPTEEPSEENPPPENGGDWWDWFFWTPKTLPVYAQEDCGYWATCSAPCNTGDPCTSDKDGAADRVLTAADKMEKEISKLQQGKEKIGGCILQEDTILLSCQEVLDMFNPGNEGKTIGQWNDIKDCRQGYNFYCTYGSDDDVYLDEIILPFETIEESIESVKELAEIVASCSCSQASFTCESCGGACGGTPCLAQTYTASASATGVGNELETRLKNLKETIAELTLMSAADEISTLTCSEAYSWLKLIKESGCPGVKVFPCCPVDEEMEKTIRNCQGTDFFFCSAP